MRMKPTVTTRAARVSERSQELSKTACLRARLVVAVLPFLLVACGEKEEVKRYTAVKDSVHEPKTAPAKEAAPTPTPTATATGKQGGLRILGAIASHGGRTWFFKLKGPAAQVEQQADRFHQFVHSVTFGDQADSPVTWTVPEEWSRVENPPGSIRYATIQVGTGEGAMELTVTPLSDQGGGAEANLNRWRGEIGLGPISDPAELRSIAETHEVNGRPVIEIDMTGPGKAETAADAPPATAEAARPPFASPSGEPPAIGLRLGPVIDGPPADAPLTYKLPEGWREHGVSPGGMRKAAFSVSSGDELAEITVIPLGPQGLLANVNRWRQEIGLPPIDQQEAEQAGSPIEVDGIEGLLFDFEGARFPDGRQYRSLVAMAKRGEITWFIKMMGSSGLVGKEKDRFEALVKSIKFKDGA